MGNTGSRLVKLTRTVYVPADKILIILDYSDPFAIRTVRDGKKNGTVWNLATVDTSKPPPKPSGAGKRRSRRPSVKSVIFLDMGQIIITGTSVQTVVKRYQEAVSGTDMEGGE